MFVGQFFGSFEHHVVVVVVVCTKLKDMIMFGGQNLFGWCIFEVNIVLIFTKEMTNKKKSTFLK